MELLSIISAISLILLLWLNVVATLAIKNDDTLERTQVIGQSAFIWLIPYFGAILVLKLAYEHTPESMPKSWIPWPLKTIIFGKPIKQYQVKGGEKFDSPSGSVKINNNVDSHDGD